MIAGIFHEGSGLGDQLMRYVTVRTLAEEKGFQWRMLNPENFKGSSFMNLQMKSGPLTIGEEPPTYFNEKETKDEKGNDIRSYDPEINFVRDSTIIDGSFEDERYWGHNLYLDEWLKVESLEVPNSKCIVGFRGGEYAAVPELFLPTTYFAEAMQQMPATVSRYEIHTDDPNLAKQTFKGSIFSVIENEQLGHSRHSNMGFNWRSARFAKYAIIPNSAFFILPRLLKHHEDPEAITIAPRFHAGFNVRQWRRPAAYYPAFTYL